MEFGAKSELYRGTRLEMSEKRFRLFITKCLQDHPDNSALKKPVKES